MNQHALSVSAEYGSTLLASKRVMTRGDVLSRPSPVPTQPGVYAWYFDVPPPGVLTEGTHQTEHGYLLYIGISPKEPPRNGKPPSMQNLRTRIRYHYCGNAAGSTLRLTLGCLLTNELGVQLRRVGSGGRFTFSTGETAISDWMAEHARVSWFVDTEPWLIESKLISELVLPLNLDQNKHSGFHAELTAVRKGQRQSALTLPVLPH